MSPGAWVGCSSRLQEGGRRGRSGRGRLPGPGHVRAGASGAGAGTPALSLICCSHRREAAPCPRASAGDGCFCLSRSGGLFLLGRAISGTPCWGLHEFHVDCSPCAWPEAGPHLRRMGAAWGAWPGGLHASLHGGLTGAPGCCCAVRAWLTRKLLPMPSPSLAHPSLAGMRGTGAAGATHARVPHSRLHGGFSWQQVRPSRKESEPLAFHRHRQRRPELPQTRSLGCPEEAGPVWALEEAASSGRRRPPRLAAPTSLHFPRRCHLRLCDSIIKPFVLGSCLK